ncbi:hypothetical protein AYO20_09691 [Fonsecaea nubica]|uniref:SnoaL-like domain-containing protein n=1 Tax=Fonsecaea nubica TaxID=856822 RepID=A0A178CD04_9EURO|nr:hypothetical protein AYO20_09691 [Fonsecaea nubica]OAL27838.1 hypothetical protein AYO20_09691 [Fonsecaea nubica]
MPSRPPFESLPHRSGDPAYSAWGLYGEDDQIGALNMLTPENTLAAIQSEVKTGIRLSLDPPLDVLAKPGAGRKGLKQTLIIRPEGPIHDDVVEFNTQVGAQWDGFRHVGYMKQRKFYNNADFDAISGANPDPSLIGIHSWVQNGSIAGRGVLLDYYSYARSQGNNYELIGQKANYSISVAELKACAAAQGTELRQGDILLVRSGLWVGYKALSEAEQKAWVDEHPSVWVGVETSREMAQWLWSSGITACAGDAAGWEKCPPNTAPKQGLEGHILHEIMLGGWGMPIGEFFDLEKLAEEYHEEIRSLGARYALAVDSRNIDALVGMFLESNEPVNLPILDAEDKSKNKNITSLRELFTKALKTFGPSFHFVGQHIINLDGDQATGTVYCICTHSVDPNSRWITMQLVYEDVYIYHEGKWLFKNRNIHGLRAYEDSPSVDSSAFLPYGPSYDIPNCWPSWKKFWGDDVPASKKSSAPSERA